MCVLAGVCLCLSECNRIQHVCAHMCVFMYECNRIQHMCACICVYVCLSITGFSATTCVCLCLSECNRVQSLVGQEEEQKGLSLSCTWSWLCFSGYTEDACLLLLAVLDAQHLRPNL